MSKKLYASNDQTKYALVDDDVFETIKEMRSKFCIMKKGYFISTKFIQLPGMTEKKRLSLHHFVFTLKTGELPIRSVDHIDRNRANNKFENLRLATRKEQQHNRGKLNNNTSGYIGVCHIHKANKYNNEYDYWLTQIHNPAGKNEVKTFPFTDDGLIAAATWYDKKAIEYFGEFHGELNFPDEK